MATSELASERACADTLLLRQQVLGTGASYRGFFVSSRCGLDSRMKDDKASKALFSLLASLAFSYCCLRNCQERTP